MRRRSRDNQQLVLSHLVRSPRDFAPTVSFCAIDENCFRASLFTSACMPLCFGIVSRVAGNQISKQWILESRGENWPRDDDYSLPREAFVFFTPFDFHLAGSEYTNLHSRGNLALCVKLALTKEKSRHNDVAAVGFPADYRERCLAEMKSAPNPRTKRPAAAGSGTARLNPKFATG